MLGTNDVRGLAAIMMLSIAGCQDTKPAGSSAALRADIEACAPEVIATVSEAQRVERCLDRIPRADVPPEEIFDLCFTRYSACVDASARGSLCTPIVDECFGTVREDRDDPERNLVACYGAADDCMAGGIATDRCLFALEGCVDSLDVRVRDLFEAAIEATCRTEHERCVTGTGETRACGDVLDACLDFANDDDEYDDDRDR